MTNLDMTADYIDVRDIIARVEELKEERQALVDAVADLGQERVTDAEEALAAWDTSEEGEELKSLAVFLEEIKGNGGDEQYEGDWYPVTLIRDSYFEAAMDELLEDIGELPKDIPSYLKIVVDYDALQMDYTSADYDGVTYWMR